MQSQGGLIGVVGSVGEVWLCVGICYGDNSMCTCVCVCVVRPCALQPGLICRFRLKSHYTADCVLNRLSDSVTVYFATA